LICKSYEDLVEETTTRARRRRRKRGEDLHVVVVCNIQLKKYYVFIVTAKKK